ncbi:MAG: hypothetical protein KIT72_13870 [Polyangiaceae bacterium]|nr:hypothetical protein [Polyangiaceae bacterium]MCW5791499.1 hypothetical protein [Polyangiaceae bacterium]
MMIRPYGGRELCQSAAVLRRFAGVAALLGVLAVYVQVLGAPFVWDDHHLIATPEVQELKGLATYFSQPFWSNPELGDARAYYRPFTVLSLALDRALHGANPAGFHLTNLVLHLLNGGLLFALMRRYQVGALSAAALALAWGVSPRLAEAAAWVAGRTDVLATTGVLLALVLWRTAEGGEADRGGERAAGQISWLRRAAALACLALGLGAKEVALAGVVALAVLESRPRALQAAPPRATKRAKAPEQAPEGDDPPQSVKQTVERAAEGGGPRSVKQTLVALAPLAALLVGYLALRSVALSGASAGVTEATPTGRLLLGLSALGHYAEMVLWPFAPALQIGDTRHLEAGRAAAGALVLLGLVLLGYRQRAALWEASPAGELRRIGLALSAVGLGLVLHLIPISVSVIAADRFLYLPLLGLTLLAAPSLTRLLEGTNGGRARLVARGFALLMLAALLVTGAQRVADWSSEVRLWTRAYHQTDRRVPVPGIELGNVYYRAGLYDHAHAIYAAAARDSQHPIAVNNALNALGQRGGHQEASAGLDALCVKEQLPKTCLDAAIAALRLGQLPAARARASQALALAPGYAPALALQTTLAEVATLAGSDTLKTGAPPARLAIHFRLAMLSGRRLEALTLAQAVLRTQGSAEREAALEYLIRFGPPDRLVALLEAAQTGPLSPDLEAAAALRITTAEELLAAWPAVGLPLPAPLTEPPGGFETRPY